MRIREFRVGDEMALHAVFHSAVHQIARRDYTAAQIEAWAPTPFDRDAWIERMRAIRPFVVEEASGIIAYADVQTSGYIDHFFVSGAFPRRGVGSLLMQHLHAVAGERGTAELTANVSRTAQPFFERFGFEVVEYRQPVARGVVVPNAAMRKTLLTETVEGRR